MIITMAQFHPFVKPFIELVLSKDAQVNWIHPRKAGLSHVAFLQIASILFNSVFNEELMTRKRIRVILNVLQIARFPMKQVFFSERT